MSSLIDELRPFWLPGINRVTGVPKQTLTGVLGDQRYQIYAPLTPTTAELYFAEWDIVTGAFAKDAAQAAMASVESIDAAPSKGSLPPGAGWLIIKTYYAGFFASHAIHRMLGKGIIKLDRTVATAISAVADVFGMRSSGNLQQGLYRVRTDRSTSRVILSKITGGSHESLWIDTVQLLRELIAGILTTSVSSSAGTVAGKLSELEKVLCEAGSNSRGSWLSVVRNRVNYEQEFGVWYPYAGQPRYCKELAARLTSWRGDPDWISLWSAQGRELQPFVEACAFLVSVCRSIALDMNARCSDGNSFHHYSTVRLLRQLKAA